MKKLTISTALFAALALASTAHAYQIELGANAAYVDPESGSTGHGFGVSGTYYLNNLPTASTPLAETAFINKASNVKAHAQWTDVGNNVDVNSYGVGGQYYVPNSKFVVGADLSRETAENAAKQKASVNTYGAEVGYLLDPNLLVAVGLRGYDAGNNVDGIDPTVRAKYLTQIGGKHVNLEANAAFGDLDQYGIKGDYFIDNSFNVGADYAHNKLTDTKEFGVSAKKFISPQASIGGRIGFGDASSQDYKNFGVEANYRF